MTRIVRKETRARQDVVAPKLSLKFKQIRNGFSGVRRIVYRWNFKRVAAASAAEKATVMRTALFES
jgi:hypothetical protein